MNKFLCIATLFLLGAGCTGTSDSYMAPEPIVEVTNFEECVAAGNPVMESSPRQCRHRGDLFVEEIDSGRLY